MRVLIQRVSRASVTVEKQTISKIGKGLLILLGVGHGDGEEQVSFLAEKVANSNTAGFRPRDLAPPSFGREVARAGAVGLAQTSPAHFSDAGGSRASFKAEPQHFAVRPAGNAVHLEEEMMKVAANQMDYQAASALYGRSLALIKLALGKSG